jgi:hypothetical protein
MEVVRVERGRVCFAPVSRRTAMYSPFAMSLGPISMRMGIPYRCQYYTTGMGVGEGTLSSY